MYPFHCKSISKFLTRINRLIGKKIGSVGRGQMYLVSKYDLVVMCGTTMIYNAFKSMFYPTSKHKFSNLKNIFGKNI